MPTKTKDPGGRKKRGVIPSPYTTLLINKVSAFFAADLGGPFELARFIGVSPTRIPGWITRRQFQPGYEYGKNIEAWLTMKEAELAAADPVKQRVFRKHFAEISKEFPHEEKEK